jgi:ElaB/YqjD/DUF883 family membrane-anchored ribosome-binding protein
MILAKTRNARSNTMTANASAEELGGRTARNGRRASAELVSGGRRTSGIAASELGNLLSDVEDLVKRVAHVSDADIAKVRERVQEKVTSARETLTAGAESVRERATAAMSTTDDYVRNSPWQAVGIAAAVGAALGYLLSRR